MEFLELAKNRYSVRSFTDEPVAPEIVNKILEAGRLAPTACNNQPQVIYAVQSPEGLEKLRKCTTCHFNETLAFIVCTNTDVCWTRKYDDKKSTDVDASIVATHMMLEAAEQGIGSTWVMFFIPEAVKTEFELPDNIVPVAMLLMGHPAEDAVPNPRHAQRRELSETVIFK